MKGSWMQKVNENEDPDLRKSHSLAGYFMISLMMLTVPFEKRPIITNHDILTIINHIKMLYLTIVINIMKFEMQLSPLVKY